MVPINIAPCQIVPVALADRSYEIVIASSALATLPQTVDGWWQRRGFKANARRFALVVTDDNVRDRHAAPVASALGQAGWVCELASLPPGEQTKSQKFATSLYDRLIDLKADRQTVVVAVGGGVIGDLAGFVAATYARGVPFVQVPTTLLAQVDSSVGGKVGINHPRGKNLIGAFYQPLGVFIDTTVLATLPERDYRSGLAEVIKYGVILDAVFFERLESSIAALNARDPGILREFVANSCSLKATVTERDEFERTGLRAILNYGHTFAHAFEAQYGYGQLLHGEAVSIGMAYAAQLARRLGRIDETVVNRQAALLSAVGLPIALHKSDRPATNALLDSMRLDKKTLGGKLRFVLPTRIGHVEVVEVAEAEVRAVLNADA